MKLGIRVLLSLALLVNMLLYAYYSFSFAVRPEDMPRGTCAILAAIYFVGLAIFLNQRGGSWNVS